MKDKLLELEIGSRTSIEACQKTDLVKQKSEKDLEAAQGHVTSSNYLPKQVDSLSTRCMQTLEHHD